MAKKHNNLKPCKCGCEGKKLTIDYNKIDGYMVVCPKCGEMSDNYPSERDAIDNWNYMVED